MSKFKKLLLFFLSGVLMISTLNLKSQAARKVEDFDLVKSTRLRLEDITKLEETFNLLFDNIKEDIEALDIISEEMGRYRSYCFLLNNYKDSLKEIELRKKSLMGTKWEEKIENEIFYNDLKQFFYDQNHRLSQIYYGLEINLHGLKKKHPREFIDAYNRLAKKLKCT